MACRPSVKAKKAAKGKQVAKQPPQQSAAASPTAGTSFAGSNSRLVKQKEKQEKEAAGNSSSNVVERLSISKKSLQQRRAGEGPARWVQKKPEDAVKTLPEKSVVENQSQEQQHRTGVVETSGEDSGVAKGRRPGQSAWDAALQYKENVAVGLTREKEVAAARRQECAKKTLKGTESSSEEDMTEDIDKHVLRKYHVYQKLGKGRTFREVMFLQEMNDHDNIIKLLNVLKAENDRDLYLVFEYMETDLHAVIRAQILEDVHKQFVMYQLFKGLLYMHSAELLHRDIKPSNLLLDSECQVKLADFGLARSVAQLKDDIGNMPILTDYVATRWYRAPEILLGSTKYTFGVDMWSSGCILGELLCGKPIFPGTSTMNQIEKILEVIGRPAAEDVAALESPFAATMLENMPTTSRPFSQVFPTASPEAEDLLHRLLHFNPLKRLTAEGALRHPYLQQFHNLSDEPICTRTIQIPIDDNTKFTIAEYRERLYQEIVQRKKEIRKKLREKERLERDLSSRSQRRPKFRASTAHYRSSHGPA